MTDPIALVKLLLVFGLIGFMVYCIVTYIPMPVLFRQAIIVITVVAMVLWILGKLV